MLHVAAEYGNIAVATLLLDRGANVNARATVTGGGAGGQTPIFHAVTQFDDDGLPATQLLLERGADLRVRARIPGSYEHPGEVVECTPWDTRCGSGAIAKRGPCNSFGSGAVWSSVPARTPIGRALRVVKDREVCRRRGRRWWKARPTGSRGFPRLAGAAL